MSDAQELAFARYVMPAHADPLAVANAVACQPRALTPTCALPQTSPVS